MLNLAAWIIKAALALSLAIYIATNCIMLH